MKELAPEGRQSESVLLVLHAREGATGVHASTTHLRPVPLHGHAWKPAPVHQVKDHLVQVIIQPLS